MIRAYWRPVVWTLAVFALLFAVLLAAAYLLPAPMPVNPLEGI
jgi:hypothetical protein